MSGDDLVRACLDELRGSDEPEAVARVAYDRRTALLGTPGVALELVRGALDDVDRTHRLALFEALIQLARTDRDNRGRFGEEFIEDASTVIEGLKAFHGFDLALAHDLSAVYARADVEAPDPLVVLLTRQFGTLTELGGIPFDPDEEIDRLRFESDGNNYMLHLALDDRLAGLPAEVRVSFVSAVALREEDFCGRLAIYWLLDSSPDIRLAAAVGLYSRACRGTVEPGAAGLLPPIRNWIPPDSARPVVDAAIRETRRRDLFAPLERPALRRKRLFATLPDRAGYQAVAALLDGDDGPSSAVLQIKSGHGIINAFVLGYDPDGQLLLLQQDEFGSIILPWEACELLLAAALAEGLAWGHSPPTGLIDFALACELEHVRPRPMTARNWLAELDPQERIAHLPAREREALIELSAAWPKDYPMVGTWSEGTGLLEGALANAWETDRMDSAIWARLEERRTDWAMLMLRAAYVLKSGGLDDWRSFAATASALLDNRALQGIPIMHHVFDATEEALFAEESRLGADDDDGAA